MGNVLPTLLAACRSGGILGAFSPLTILILHHFVSREEETEEQ